MLFLLVLLGCEKSSDDWKVEVSSDTSWEGDFYNQHIAGNGNQRIDLPDNVSTCCVVKKKTEAGFLRVTIINDGLNPTSPGGQWNETTKPYGTVSGCTGRQ